MKVSSCTLDCPDLCSFSVEGDGEKARVRGNPDHPFTRGFTCNKGPALLKRINHPDRIVYPLLKKNGEFTPISWDNAFDLCEERIKGFSPEEILHIKGFGYRGVLAKASKVFFNHLGALEVYGSLCDEAGCEAVATDFGTLDHNDPEEILNSDCIVNWGRDLSRSSVHYAALVRQARKNGARVISISPGGDGNPAFSDDMVLIRPGTDRFLAAALCRMIIDSGKANPELAACSKGLDVFLQQIGSHSLEELLSYCDVSLEDAKMLFRAYRDCSAVSSLIGWGVQRYVHGAENVRYINALGVISGHIGRSGAGIYYNISSSRNFAPWALKKKVPPQRSIPLQSMKDTLEQREMKVRMIWVDGINVANQVPDCSSAAALLEETEFVVGVDAFMNDTLMRCDLILPCALTMEREDLLGSAGNNFVNWSAKVLEPRGEARSDFEIMRELGSRIFDNNPIPEAEECLHRALGAGMNDESLEEIKQRGFARGKWPAVAYEGLRFGYEDGKCRLPEKLSVPENLSQPEQSSSPESSASCFSLLTLLRRNRLHSQIPEDEQQGLPILYISDSSPCLCGLSDGSRALLKTELGEMKVVLQIDPSIHPEAAIIRRGGWMKHGHSANPIIAPLITDMGYGAAYYSQKAWLECL